MSLINAKPGRGGSRPGKRPNMDRGHAEGQMRIYHDYFSPSPVLGPTSFQRRHRIPLAIYEEMKAAILTFEHDKYAPKDRFFEQRTDCCGRVGISADQKMLAALRMLASGHSPDDAEPYYRISETVAAKSLAVLCQRLVDVWGSRCAEELRGKRATWLSGNVWQHRLLPLDLAWLPSGTSRLLPESPRRSQRCFTINCGSKPLDLGAVLRRSWLPQ